MQIPQTPREIQNEIDQAKTRLAQRDHILNQLAELDGRLQTLKKQTQSLERQAIKAKQKLDNLKSRVLPMLSGWLSGKGKPAQQEASAEKLWHTAEKILSLHIKTISQLETEHELLGTQLLTVAAADDELTNTYAMRDHWLITHMGEDGRALDALINDINKLTAEHDQFQAALTLIEETLTALGEVTQIFYVRRLSISGIEDLTSTVENRAFSVDMNYYFYSQEAIKNSLHEADTLLGQLQTQLTGIKERLSPNPTINWKSIPNVSQAHLRVTQEAKKIEQKQKRLQHMAQEQSKRLLQLTQERTTLTHRLWTAAINQ